MKIRNSSKVIAIVMALMMIVPLISVPAVAIEKVDNTKADPVLFENFEGMDVGAASTNSVISSLPTKAEIVDINGNKALQMNLKPDTTHADGTYFIKSSQSDKETWYVANVDDDSFDLDENDNELYSGTVSIGGTTYYFQNAVVNFEKAETACALYTDEACTNAYTAYTWHLVQACVRNAIQGQSNIAKEVNVGAGTTGSTYVFSADYFFATDIANKKFDFRMKGNNGNIHFGHFQTSASGVTVNLHTDLKSGIIYNPGVTVAKGEWFNVTVVAVSAEGKTSITIYVDGKIAGVAEQATAISTLSTGWNLGHVQRGGTVSSYYGTWCVDNIAVYTTTDVIPSNWDVYDPNKILNQNFDESTSLPSNLTWKGSNYEIVTDNGNNYLKLDAGITGNQDKPIELKTGKVQGGIVQIDVDFYIPSNAQFGYQAQFGEMYAKGATAFGGTPASTQSRYTWVDLYFVRANGGKAWISQVSDLNALAKAKTVYYDTALPTDKFFTISTVINMATGEFMIFVDGAIAAKSYLFRTNNFLTDCYFNDAKLFPAKINKPNTAGLTSMSGALSVDNIVVKKIDAMPVIKLSTNEDFESYTAGTHAESPSNRPTVAPATATYKELYGNKFVEISLLGATAPDTLEVPFISTNSRSYDIKETVESFDSTQEITVELLKSLTFTGSINNPANDKPIYYAYVESEGIVYVYNAGGVALAADGSNIGSFWLEKHTIGEANYNAMFRAMCGGKDANIDKNFRVKHAPLDAAGTYVLSADYFVDANASGAIQSQSYNEAATKWLDLYQLDLNTKTFSALNGATAGGEKALPLIVNDWNTVTMIVTVADDLSFSADIYLNGVYSHTKAFDYSFNANSWILAKIAKPSMAQVQKMAGYVYLDNVKVNAEEYDANKAQTIDASNVLGFDIDGKSIVNVSASEELKLYGAEIIVRDSSFLEGRVLNNVVNTEAVASIRIQGPTGLRFVTNIAAANLMQLDSMIAAGKIKGYNVGTLIAPTDYITDGKELTFDYFTEDVDMLDVEATVGMWYEGYDEDPSTTHFAGSIVNIFTANYNRAFSGRGYIQVTMMNGEVITVYSAYTHSVSVAEQAQKTLDAGIYEEGSNEYNVLVNFTNAQ